MKSISNSNGPAQENFPGSLVPPPPVVEAHLSPALSYLERFPHFIVCSLTPNPSAERPWKLDKMAVDPETNIKLEWTTPSNWWTYEAALNAAARASLKFGGRYGVGFVITPETKIFCLDIDGALQKGVSCPGCFNEDTRQMFMAAGFPEGLKAPNPECTTCVGQGAYQWHPLVSKLRGALPQAGCELSVSQDGLHNWGRYEGPEPAHAKVKIVEGIKIELFTGVKWFALGDQATGDAGADQTVELHQVIAQYFPPDAAAIKKDWAEGHELGWELPADDELIRLALSFGGGASAAFGDGVSFADLWTRNVSKLSKRYPSDNEEFDESGADLALAGKLAWLTGNDCPRIERLMWKSFLSRDKWESHKTYLSEFTIPRALRQDGDFWDPKYKEKKQQEAERRREQIEEATRIGEGSQEHLPAEVITLEQMLERYLYIEDGDRVQDLKHPRLVVPFDQFVKSHRSSKTVQDVEGELNRDGTQKTKSYESARLWEHGARSQVKTVTFRPGHLARTVDPDGNPASNTWRPIERSAPTVGDPSLFLNHVNWLFGADAPRFLDWLAHIEQNPGVVPHTAWLHVSLTQGKGRNWLANVLCRVWEGYVANNFNLSRMLKTGFDGRLSKKTLVIVDEIHEGGSNARWDSSESLKQLITADTREINPKYGFTVMEWSAARWLMFSNHVSAIPLDDKDRRFEVVKHSEGRMPDEYYERLWAVVKDPGFIASVAWMLHTRDISGFKPGAHAQMSEAKREMIGASRSEVDDIISDLIETHPADLITNNALGSILNSQPFGGQLNAHQRYALDRAGTLSYGKTIKVTGKVVRVRILRNHERWKLATPPEVQAELIKEMGAPPPVM
jgi:primase-polymerase (primpol)-like protein